MLVVYAMLSLNLLLVTVCLMRTTHRDRPSLDTLLRQAQLSSPATAVPAVAGQILSFRTRSETEIAQARSLHPSSGLAR